MRYYSNFFNFFTCFLNHDAMVIYEYFFVYWRLFYVPHPIINDEDEDFDYDFSYDVEFSDASSNL